MILDSNLVLSAAQAVTSTGDTPSTNVYDTGAAQDEAVGESVILEVLVNTALTSGGSATAAVVLQTSADNSSWSDVIITPATAYNSAPYTTAGATVLRTKLPTGLKRYIRVAYRVATAALTGGKFDARIVKDAFVNPAYAAGFTVS